MIHVTEVEVPHELTTITKTQIHRTDIALHRKTNSVMTKILLLHNTLDHDMITTKEIPDHTVLLIDLRIDLPIDMTLVIDIDYVPIQEITTILQNIQPPIDHLQNHEILLGYSRSGSHSNTRNELKTIQPQHQTDPINFEVHMYHPRWRML